MFLDAGCGAGHTAASFAPHVAEVVALDFTASMLRQVEVLAKDRDLTNVNTRLGDVESLPFADAGFDLVVSRYSAHHWARPEQALGEFRRVLRGGGKFVLSDVLGFGDYVCDTYLNAIEVLRDPSHVRDYTLEEWEDFLPPPVLDWRSFFPTASFSILRSGPNEWLHQRQIGLPYGRYTMPPLQRRGRRCVLSKRATPCSARFYGEQSLSNEIDSVISQWSTVHDRE